MNSQRSLTHTRDIVVIGCSAGGVEALPRILQQLPPDLPAAVFIVQHLSAKSGAYLAEILARHSRLPVEWAEQGTLIQPHRVLVAPPDVHMLLSDGHVRLTRGARENHARPSIDKLFRSAAVVYGGRVIGVLLTGMLDDGVAGLVAIRDAGGVVIVQDPTSAAFPELPRSALAALAPDRTLQLDAIAPAIQTLVRELAGTSAVSPHVALEAELDRVDRAAPETLGRLGAQTTLVCPECRGPLWNVGSEGLRRYRCYLGHVASASDLLDASALEVESALWSAVRALNDRASTLETLATDATRIGNGQSSESYATRARETREQAELARRFMIDLGRSR